ncbi:hypothetical protein D3C73_18000 [compost metagenome]
MSAKRSVAAKLKSKKPGVKNKTSHIKKIGAPFSRLSVPQAAICILAALALIWVSLLLFNNYRDTNAKLSQMEIHLESKYGKDFVVENLRVEGGGFGVKGSQTGDAYPKDDTSMRFEISKPEYDPGDNYRDTFLTKLWSKQGLSELEVFLSQELPDTEKYKLTIRAGFDFQKNLKGHTPSYTEAKNKYPGEFSYTLEVQSSTTSDTIEPPANELARALKVIEFVKAQNSNTPEIYYSYIFTDSTETKTYMNLHVDSKVMLDSIKGTDDIKNNFSSKI